jgi:hypothetical protein
MKAQKIIDQFVDLLNEYYTSRLSGIKQTVKHPASIQKEQDLEVECHRRKCDFLKAVKELIEPKSRKRAPQSKEGM